MLNTTSGMIQFSTNTMRIKLCEGVPENKMERILHHCHAREVGGHFGATKTAAKVLQSEFYWPTLFKDAYTHVKACDACQRMENISRSNEVPLNNILEVELFDV